MKNILITAILLVLSVATVSAAAKNNQIVQHGKASWYSVQTNNGTRTASGKRLTNDGSVAAHKTLPMGTIVKVTNLKNNKAEIVTIIDRGPYVKGRIVDVSVGVAKKLGFHNSGTTTVKLEVIK